MAKKKLVGVPESVATGHPSAEQVEQFCDEFCALVGKFSAGKVGAPPAPVDVNRNDPAYKKARRQLSGLLSIVTGYAFMSGSSDQIDQVLFISQVANDHFDEWWVIKHPQGI